MKRVEYIHKQKSEFSRKVIGVLPVLFPKEIFTALDIVAVEIWGPPGVSAGSRTALIQSFFCPIVRNALSFIEAGKADVVDALLIPHTCDSLKSLAALLAWLPGWNKPVLTFQHPRGPERPEVVSYLREEIASLAGSLERAFGLSLDEGRLESAIKLHEEAEALKRKLLSERRRFKGSSRELYSLLRMGEFLRVEDHLPLLRQAVAQLAPQPLWHGIPTLVTGYVPEPMSILDALAAAGILVAACDYAAVGRRIARAPSSGRRPGESVGASSGLDAVVSRYLSLPPCSTRALDPSARISYLSSLARQSGCEGVIFHEVKFCEPQLFDVPSLRAAFEAMQLPVLTLETELETELPSRVVTMIETFAEMLRSRKKPEASTS